MLNSTIAHHCHLLCPTYCRVDSNRTVSAELSDMLPVYQYGLQLFRVDAWRAWDRRRLVAVLGPVVACNVLIWWQQEPLRQLLLSVLSYGQLR